MLQSSTSYTAGVVFDRHKNTESSPTAFSATTEC